MKVITFNIELLQPLLVTQLGGGDENSAVSQDYIPGSVLRNALAARYIAARQLADAAADPDCRALFFDGGVCVLNALPTDRQGKRSLPTPLSWYADKEPLAEWNKNREVGLLTFYDAAVEPEIIREMKDAKPLGNTDYFCRWQDDSVEFVRAEHQVSVHISREHKRQLKTKADSQVFSYEAIAQEEVFCGAILSADEDLLGQMGELLRQSPEFSIGGSRSAGYGLVRFTEIDLQPAWHEYQRDDEATDEEFTTITLLSDVPARDENGQFCNDISALIGAIQSPQHCFRRIKVVGGFNRKWGLPLPQAQAIQAGSVFVYPAGAVDETKLQQAVEVGIGEHRQDGFGRIAINWQTSSKLQAQQIPRDKTQAAYTLEPSAQRVAQRLVEHQLRQRLDLALQKAISDLKITGTLSNAVLSRLRLAARQAVAQQNVQPLHTFLTSAEKKQAGQSLQKVHLGEDTFYVWLKKHTDHPNIELLLQFNLKNSLSFNDVRAELTGPLHHEYTARLIEGVARHKIKQQKKEEK